MVLGFLCFTPVCRSWLSGLLLFTVCVGGIRTGGCQGKICHLTERKGETSFAMVLTAGGKSFLVTATDASAPVCAGRVENGRAVISDQPALQKVKRQAERFIVLSSIYNYQTSLCNQDFELRS